MKKKISVLLVNPSSKLGGGNTVSNNLAVGLDKGTFKVFSFFPQEGPAVSILKKVPDITLLISTRSDFFSIFYFLLNFLNKNRIDIIHAQGTRAAFWVKLVFLFLRKKPKFIYTLHGLHIIYRPFFQKYPLLFLERFFNNLVDRLVCPSLSVKSSVEKYKIIKREKIELIYNGIDIGKFSRAVPYKKEKLNLPPQAIVVSAIQRLDYPKDILTVLKSFRIIKELVNNTWLVIVGDGPLRLKLQEQACILQISDKILFLGARRDIEKIIAMSEIVVLSSRFEALGLTLLEAMADGKPVIGSKVEGISEIIKPGLNGFLFELGNDRQLAYYLEKLIKDPKLRLTMGKRGFRFVKKSFDLKSMIKKYERLYLTLLKSKSNKIQ